MLWFFRFGFQNIVAAGLRCFTLQRRICFHRHTDSLFGFQNKLTEVFGNTLSRRTLQRWTFTGFSPNFMLSGIESTMQSLRWSGWCGYREGIDGADYQSR
jgi:hypothetical protein